MDASQQSRPLQECEWKMTYSKREYIAIFSGKCCNVVKLSQKN